MRTASHSISDAARLKEKRRLPLENSSVYNPAPCSSNATAMAHLSQGCIGNGSSGLPVSFQRVCQKCKPSAA